MKRIAAVIAVTAIVMALAAATAGAEPPVVSESEQTITYPFIDFDTGADICGFPVLVEDTFTVKQSFFFRSDGTLESVSFHFNGSTHWTSGGGEAWENYVFNLRFDPETGILTETGNRWNVHTGAGGVLVNDSGRALFDLSAGPPGELISFTGPHQSLEGDFDDLCAALAP